MADNDETGNANSPIGTNLDEFESGPETVGDALAGAGADSGNLLVPDRSEEPKRPS